MSPVRPKLLTLHNFQSRHHDIDQLDPDERHDDSPHAVDEQIAAEEGGGRERPEPDSAQRERYQRDDDQRVEDDGAQDRAQRRLQGHDVQGTDRREGGHEHGRDDGEVLGDIVGHAEGRQGSARDQHLLADLDDLDELGRVGVQVHHVARLLGGLGAGIHGDPHVGLGQRGRIVGAVSGHGDEVPGRLLAADQRQLVLGPGLGQEIVHPGLAGDGRRGQAVVARDHDGLDPHRAEPLEAVLAARL